MAGIVSLSREDLLSILSDHKDVEHIKFLADSDKLEIKEIGDGNLNEIHRVQHKDGQSLIVKFAPPYVKCIGPEFPLATNRLDIEHRALVKYNQLCPGHSPIPYFNDQGKHLFAMEDLKEHEVLRSQLMRGELNMQAVTKLAYFTACLHRETHVAKLGEDEIKVMDQQFKNEPMVELTNNFIFTYPFIKDQPTNKIADQVLRKANAIVYDSPRLLENAAKMKQIFLTKKEALVHGDLHSGSVMVKEDSIKVIDAEFAFVGPCAFDLALILSHYIISHYQHMLTRKDNQLHRQFAYKCIDACHKTVETYLTHMTSYHGNKDEYISNLMSETAGFTGCELIRRVLGTAHVEDIKDSPSAEECVLDAGGRLLNAYERIHSIDRIMFIGLAMC
ncbi:unnamed protein product [Owenia fusiformis]|uniref:S-methyl-5-thioribose kinase n=1 Tax=Owenia fusiformis TaxID=6347 RepID=A0A8S4PV59_OWEFU|nr:unnamed protein product [Owenia fusiformis]